MDHLDTLDAPRFQDEGMAIVDIAARISPDVRVLTIDTGRLPAGTLDMIEQVRRTYGIQVEVSLPDPGELNEMVRLHGLDLFRQSVSRRRLCCEIRKVRPLDEALQGVDAWATGLRRAQSAERGNAPRTGRSDGRLKLNPLADWTDQQLAGYLAEHHVPRHPLYARGYSSIGCDPCTRPAASGREGRWWWEQDAVKECSLHFMADGKARREVDILLEEILNAQRIHTVDDGHVRSGQEHRLGHPAGTLPPGRSPG
ncbi:MAG: phosphoadenylyl-sulfate reductase [Acidobacteria bacterium]|nr:phosphoadenylyl-sulfate reductase [Acidobacteriota bacterium]